jgi:hypothetical protein
VLALMQVFYFLLDIDNGMRCRISLPLPSFSFLPAYALNMNCDIAFTYMNEIRPLNGMVK